MSALLERTPVVIPSQRDGEQRGVPAALPSRHRAKRVLPLTASLVGLTASIGLVGAILSTAGTPTPVPTTSGDIERLLLTPLADGTQPRPVTTWWSIFADVV